jgi:GNAT superfamily N-acetyltransferase
VIQDPSDELLDAVRRAGDDPTPADRAAVELVRRRFGLSLPLPFTRLPGAGEEIPVRAAVAVDGPAIAATKWRSWRLAYEGILPAPFLAGLSVYPPAGYWTGRAAVPPSNRHALFVAGAKGTVVGLASVEPDQVKVLYVDPLVQRRGVGRALLGAAVDHARDTGASELHLWVAEGNGPARAFYEAAGWEVDGERQRFVLEPGVEMDEVRYRYKGRLAP